MANALEVTLMPPGQQAASGSGAPVDIDGVRSACRADLVVTEVAGGSVSVAIETSPDGATGWRQVAGFQAVSHAGARLTVTAQGCDRYLRAVWVLAPAATAAFAVQGTAHTLFANLRDLQGEVPPNCFDHVPAGVIADKLISASCDAEDALSHSRELPITQWSSSVRRRVAQIAAYLVIKWRGFNPDNAADEIIMRDAERAEKWLERVAKDRLRPANTTPESAMGPRVSSGNPDNPAAFRRRMSDNWGCF